MLYVNILKIYSYFRKYVSFPVIEHFRKLPFGLFKGGGVRSRKLFC